MCKDMIFYKFVIILLQFIKFMRYFSKLIDICINRYAPLKSKNFGGANLRTMKRRAIMTKKQIVNTIGWTVIVFAILASYRYYIGVDNWVEETLNWVIPAAVGYFLGYGQAQKDQRR